MMEGQNTSINEDSYFNICVEDSVTNEDSRDSNKTLSIFIDNISTTNNNHCIAEKAEALKTLRSNHKESLTELFFLQNGGNLMDYSSWKKRPNKLLECFLESEKLEDEEPSKENTFFNQRALEDASLINDDVDSQINMSYSDISFCGRMEETMDESTMESQEMCTSFQENGFATNSPLECSQTSIQESVAGLARQEAQVLKKITELRKHGLWSMRRMTKAYEPPRQKVHWDYVLEEMQWLANDFAQERKTKRSNSKKISRLIGKYFQDLQQKDLKAEKEDSLKLKKIASNMSKIVKEFWSNIEKVIQFKQQSRVDEKRKKALDLHLNFIVDQTEKYSTWLSEGLVSSSSTSQVADEAGSKNSPKENVPPEIQLDSSITSKLISSPVVESDAESYVPSGDEDVDDEETINEEEKIEKVDYKEELSSLQRESEMSLEDLYAMYYSNANVEADTDNTKEDKKSKEDKKESKDLKLVDNVKKMDDKVNKEEEKEFSEKRNNLEENISDIAKTALSFQPTGNTLETTHVNTPVPFLLKHQLREYQHVGLDWLATMYEQRLNGILADEMGLGKTIQTIALLGFLATEKGIWGPHLIVVPTSVMLNWEMEFKKWCPGFKILTYYGSLKERKAKRQGWSKTNAFHVCITSYKLVIQDHQAFRRKKWKYFILDEAHNIKNFKSQRWQTLLNFHSQRRLLLTGTPLQNNLMELWSLMHFLMPHVFQSHSEFKEWFSNPLTGMIEGSKEYNDSLIRRLHKVLRPFLLRRLKQDVEKQMPKKYEHVVMCRLSKHQRYLYDDFMSQTKTKETLAAGHFMSVINILMQLRKVCNHPNLFDPRPVVSPFHMEALRCSFPRLIINDLSCVAGRPSKVEAALNLHAGFADLELTMGKLESCELREIHSRRNSFFFHYPEVLSMKVGQTQCDRMTAKQLNTISNSFRYKEEFTQNLKKRRLLESRSKLEGIIKRNERKCNVEPMYGSDLRSLLTIREFKDFSSLSWSGQGDFHCSHAHEKNYDWYWRQTNFLSDLVCTFDARLEKMADIFSRFVFVIPPATASPPNFHPIPASTINTETTMRHILHKNLNVVTANLHEIKIKQTVQFPDLRLIQYDCGKLQAMDVLLRQLKQGSHRVLIFTQMTKMLDVLEQFLNYHGHRYLRLDGSTKVEQRQVLMERFNMDRKIFCFILSTRSGGIGVNLTGADTVIFYDSDWNPTMDAQAQDRCHRIGQTRDVHIYRLVSERSIEENILKKANEKRLLGSVAIEGGNFTTAFFKQHSLRELFEEPCANPGLAVAVTEESAKKEVPIESASQLTEEQIEQALCAAEDETDILAAKTAKAEQKEELAEFDESLPWEDSRYNESSENKINKEDVSVVEAELAMLDKNLTPIERYAVTFMEVQLAPITNEELSKAEEEVGIAREEWELNHLKAIKEEEERKAEMEEDEMLYVPADMRERKVKPKKSKLPYLEMKRKMFFARSDKEAKKKADANDNRHWATPVVPGQRKRLKVQKLPKSNLIEDDSDMPVRHPTKKFKPDGSIKQKLEFSTPPAKKPKLSSFNIPTDFLRAQINSVQKSLAEQQLNNKASDDVISNTSINNTNSTPKLLFNRQFQAPNKMIVIQRFPSLLAARPLVSQPRVGQLNQPRIGQLNQLGVSQLNQPRVGQLNQRPTTSIISKMSENKPVPILEKMQENAAYKNNIIASQPIIFNANPLNHLATRPLLLTSHSNGLPQVTNRPALPTSGPVNYIVLKNPALLGQNFIFPNSSPKTNLVLVSNAHRPVTNIKPNIFILSNNNVASLVTTSATQTMIFSSPTVQTQQRFTRLIGQIPNSTPQKVTASLLRSPASLQQAPSNTVPILEKMAMQLENQNRPSIPLTFKLSSDPRFSHPNSIAVPRNAVTWAVGNASGTSLIQSKPAVNLNVSPPRLILGQNLCFNSVINQSSPQIVIINNRPPPTGNTTPTNARFNL